MSKSGDEIGPKTTGRISIDNIAKNTSFHWAGTRVGMRMAETVTHVLVGGVKHRVAGASGIVLVVGGLRCNNSLEREVLGDGRSRLGPTTSQ